MEFSTEQPTIVDLSQHISLLKKHLGTLDLQTAGELKNLLFSQVQTISEYINRFPEQQQRSRREVRRVKKESLDLVNAHITELKRTDQLSYAQLKQKCERSERQCKKLQKIVDSLREKVEYLQGQLNN